MMKKVVATVLTFLATIHAYALPVGNPWDATLLCQGIWCKKSCPDQCDPCSSIWNAWNVRIGFYGDYVFNQHMQIDGHNSDASVHSTKLFTNAGYIALNFWERFDLFTTLGSTQIQIETRSTEASSPLSSMPLWVETDTHFSWSLGVRGTLWECGCLGIGAEAQYFQTKPDINFSRISAAPGVQYQKDRHLKYKEWQIGLGASYWVGMGWCSTALVPYVAVKWGRARVTNTLPGRLNNENASLLTLRNENEWGYALGLTLVGCNKMSVTVEGRFANENAIYANTQFRF